MVKSPKKDRKDGARITHKGDHDVITPDYNLRTFARKVEAPAQGGEAFDMEALKRAEEALANLAGEFESWMDDEVASLRKARQALKALDNAANRSALYRAAHDLRGGSATYGYPIAGQMADSLCRLLDGCGDFALPISLVDQHVDAIFALVNDKANTPDRQLVATLLAKELRLACDGYIISHGGEIAE